MINITKNEKEYLLQKGCRWYEEIHASTTRRHYYATETPKVKRLLKEYNNKLLKKATVKSES